MSKFSLLSVCAFLHGAPRADTDNCVNPQELSLWLVPDLLSTGDWKTVAPQLRVRTRRGIDFWLRIVEHCRSQETSVPQGKNIRGRLAYCLSFPVIAFLISFLAFFFSSSAKKTDGQKETSDFLAHLPAVPLVQRSHARELIFLWPHLSCSAGIERRRHRLHTRTYAWRANRQAGAQHHEHITTASELVLCHSSPSPRPPVPRLYSNLSPPGPANPRRRTRTTEHKELRVT